MVFYHNDKLFIQKTACEKLVRKHGSPIYVYDLKGISQRVLEYKNAFNNQIHIHYAMKANNNVKILKNFKKQGLGIDTVSWGEIQHALKCGFKPQDLIFSGVGKTETELKNAIQKNIFQINVESPQELERIGSIAKKLKKTARIGFRINPDVNPQTHPYITTGFRENKFGMDESYLPELKIILKKYSKNVNLQGLTLHVGSQLLNFDSILEAIQKTIPLYTNLLREGFDMKTFDIGGGVGVPYDGSPGPNLHEYGQKILELLTPLGCQILSEPGRILVGQFGVLLTQVQYIKNSHNPQMNKNFVIVDTGMHHLIRPALYQAEHRIWPVVRRHEARATYDVVGPICESSDFLGKEIDIHGLKSGDVLAILDVGAYGATMASNYNMHPAVREIVLD